MRIPFDGQGREMSTCENPYKNADESWLDLEDFHGQLTLVDISTGRSRVTFHLKNELDGRVYVMNLRQFTKCLPIKAGLSGVFGFNKQGEFYTIVPKQLDRPD